MPSVQSSKLIVPDKQPGDGSEESTSFLSDNLANKWIVN